MRFLMRPLFWMCISASVFFGTVFVLKTRPVATISQSRFCSDDWYELPPSAEFERCQDLSQQLKETGLRWDVSQAALNPTAVVLMPTFDPNHTPETLVSANTIYKVDPNDAADGPPALRGPTTIWHIGALTTVEPDEYTDVYVLTKPPREGYPALLCTVLGYGPKITVSAMPYHQCWAPLQAMGLLEITNVPNAMMTPQGPTGRVDFVTTTGGSGSFDLTTHIWTITAAGTPVAVPQSSPSSTPAA